MAGEADVQWCFSQVNGAIHEYVAEGEKAWRAARGRVLPQGGFPDGGVIGPLGL
uniref:Uncharacterized protein n=1 Tax=Monodelphis domestica TaxID=13616 RepID=A0A5F8H829_MONDO